LSRSTSRQDLPSLLYSHRTESNRMRTLIPMTLLLAACSGDAASSVLTSPDAGGPDPTSDAGNSPLDAQAPERKPDAGGLDRPEGSSPEASLDSARAPDVATVDAGPLCSPACAAWDQCIWSPEGGAPACLSTIPGHCRLGALPAPADYCHGVLTQTAFVTCDPVGDGSQENPAFFDAGPPIFPPPFPKGADCSQVGWPTYVNDWCCAP
jgi:hypothetical protein